MNMRDIIDRVSDLHGHRLDEKIDPYLYHGTQLGNALAIVRDNRIDGYTERDHLSPAVSTSRDPRLAFEVGTWFDRIYPVMFVLDRRALATRYKITPHADVDSDGNIWGAGVGHTRGTESEERVIGSIAPLDRYLVSIIAKSSDLVAAMKDDDLLNWTVEESGLFQSLDAARAALSKFARHPKLNTIVVPGLRL